jgi:hypothetical protein
VCYQVCVEGQAVCPVALLQERVIAPDAERVMLY